MVTFWLFQQSNGWVVSVSFYFRLIFSVSFPTHLLTSHLVSFSVPRTRSSVSVEVERSNACFKMHNLYMSIPSFNNVMPNISAIFGHLEFWDENRKIGINFFSVAQLSPNKIYFYYLGHDTPVCNHLVFKELYLAAILENRPFWPPQNFLIGHNLASN